MGGWEVQLNQFFLFFRISSWVCFHFSEQEIPDDTWVGAAATIPACESALCGVEELERISDLSGFPLCLKIKELKEKSKNFMIKNTLYAIFAFCSCILECRMQIEQLIPEIQVLRPIRIR